MKQGIEIQNLDHVAIRSKNVEESVEWYKNVLGLKEYRKKEWGDFPVFLLAGKTGVAIFPADLNGREKYIDSRDVGIEHFAFYVEDLQKSINVLKSKGMKYDFQDHHFFHSIYMRDPDNHKVELTTLVVNENEFF